MTTLARTQIVLAICSILALTAGSADSAWAAKGDTTLISRAAGANGAGGNGRSDSSSASADGRFVAFSSEATNLTPDDSDSIRDIFVRDTVTNTNTLISRASGAAGVKGDADSHIPKITPDGRYVLFESVATNLSNDDGPDMDVFVRDTVANTTTLISRQGATDGGAGGDDYSEDPAITPDGRFVAFESNANNLVVGEDETVSNVFVRDTQNNTTTFISQSSTEDSGDGDSQDPVISDDGNRVAFESDADNFGESAGNLQIYVRDVGAGDTLLVSCGDEACTVPGDDDSSGATISGDGNRVAFQSDAGNLGPDIVSEDDVFVRDLQANSTTLVSRADGQAGTLGSDSSSDALISGNGRYVAFTSSAEELTDADDPLAASDVFVRDLEAGTTTFVSRVSGPNGAGADRNGNAQSISPDGRFVTFDSEATNLNAAANPSFNNLYMRDLLGPNQPPGAGPPVAGNDTVLASRAGGANGLGGDDRSNLPSVSGDGRYVAFESKASNLTLDDIDSTRDIFVRDTVANTTTLISRETGVAGAKGDDDSGTPQITPDGRYVVFESLATNFSNADSPERDIFVRDTVSNTTTLVSRQSAINGGAGGDEAGGEAAITPDGRFVAWDSGADNLAVGENEADSNIFLRDIVNQTTALVSVSNTEVPADGYSGYAAISDDGKRVAFESDADNLGAVDDIQIIVRDITAGTTTVASCTGNPCAIGDDDSDYPSISGDGTRVAFESDAENLTPESSNTDDVFVRDLPAKTTTLVSRGNGPAGAVGGNFEGSREALISGNGRYVAFESDAEAFTPDDHPSAGSDVFVRDLQLNTTTFVSRAAGPNGEGADRNSGARSISPDGRYVAFDSGATNLSPAADPEFDNVYLRDALVTTGPSPGPGPAAGQADASPGATKDSKAPALDAKAATKQSLAGGALTVTVTCDEACSLGASASVNVPGASKVFKLKRAQKTLAAGVKTKVKIKLTSKARKAAKRALKRRKRVKATISLQATDPALNSSSVKRTIRLVR